MPFAWRRFKIPDGEVLEGDPGQLGFLIQVFDRLVARHPAEERLAGLALVQGGRQVPVEDHLGFIQVDGGGAVGAGEEDLPFVRVQLAAALGAVDPVARGEAGASLIGAIIADNAGVEWGRTPREEEGQGLRVRGKG